MTKAWRCRERAGLEVVDGSVASLVIKAGLGSENWGYIEGFTTRERRIR